MFFLCGYKSWFWDLESVRNTWFYGEFFFIGPWHLYLVGKHRCQWVWPEIGNPMNFSCMRSNLTLSITMPFWSKLTQNVKMCFTFDWFSVFFNLPYILQWSHSFVVCMIWFSRVLWEVCKARRHRWSHRGKIKWRRGVEWRWICLQWWGSRWPTWSLG